MSLTKYKIKQLYFKFEKNKNDSIIKTKVKESQRQRDDMYEDI